MEYDISGNAGANVETDAGSSASNRIENTFASCPEAIHGSSTCARTPDTHIGCEEGVSTRNCETHPVIVLEEPTVYGHSSIPSEETQNVFSSEAQERVGSDVLVHKGKRKQFLEHSEAGISKGEGKEELSRQRPAKRSKLSTARSRLIPSRSLPPRRRIVSSPIRDETEDISDLSFDTIRVLSRPSIYEPSVARIPSQAPSRPLARNRIQVRSPESGLSRDA